MHFLEFTPTAHVLAIVVLAVALGHAMGALARRLGQPQVVGEIAAGLLLGPSILGLLHPNLSAMMFPKPVLAVLDVTAQIGLIGFMFLLGHELRVYRRDTPLRHVVRVGIASFAVPFVFGSLLAIPLYRQLAAHGVSKLALVLFFGLALAITAVPVLYRVLTDIGLRESKTGRIAMGAAVATDAVAWIVLTGVLVVAGGARPAELLGKVGGLAVIVAVLVFGARPLLRWVVARTSSRVALLTIIVTGSIASAIATQLIGLHFVFGAVAFGAIVPAGSPLLDEVCRTIHDFTRSVLLPLFFVSVGIKVSFGSFDSAAQWLILLAVIVVAIVTKLGGVGISWRLGGGTTAESARLGVLMSCRGMTELVVADIGLRAGILSPFGFGVLVLVALVTTALTVPMLRLTGTHPELRPLQKTAVR